MVDPGGEGGEMRLTLHATTLGTRMDAPSLLDLCAWEGGIKLSEKCVESAVARCGRLVRKEEARRRLIGCRSDKC